MRPNEQLGTAPTGLAPERVLFHSDFDGICAAAVLLRVFGTDLGLEPVDYGARGSWLRRRIEDAAVVDFLFHPEARWWFDHHSTSFLTPELKDLYRPGPRHRWDPSYSSCPPLVLDVLGESQDVSIHRKAMSSWIEWADIIDAAKYRSPQEATLGDTPCILINQALMESNDPDLRCDLVRRIAGGAEPEEAASEETVKDLWESYRRNVDRSLEILRERYSRAGTVGHVDILGTPAMFLRYGMYCLDPDLDYSLTAYNARRGRETYKISLSFNPWKDAAKNRIHLGQLARQYGGGGREMVGSIAFRSAAECREALARIVGEVEGSARHGNAARVSAVRITGTSRLTTNPSKGAALQGE